MEKPKSNLWHRLQHPSATHSRWYFMAAVGICLVGGVGVWLYLVNAPSSTVADNSVGHKKATPVYYSPLTGLKVDNEATTKLPVTAIMIENSPDARPQSGLHDAGVVFEAIAEGGITRFVALYQEAKPSLIGPVRSVRPYYVEWAAGFDDSMAHVGGSSRALSMIRSGDYGVDLDQFFNGSYYWRSTDRVAPHNVYTSFDKLDALNASKGHTTSSFQGFARSDGETAAKPTATSIDLDVSTGYYTVHYDYDSKTNTYKRSEGGQPHLDREKGQITPNVVIGMKVTMAEGEEDGIREQITTSGSGEADVFQNGTITPATWHKDTPKGPLTFTDKNGKIIALNRGQTWITALASDRSISWQ